MFLTRKKFWKLQKRIDDAISSSLSLDKLMQSLNSYLPVTSMSLDPFHMAMVLNDIVINNRQNILEFGGGISTILIPKLLTTNAIDAKLITVEHDREWLKVLSIILKAEGLENKVQTVAAPLEQNGDFYWYSQDIEQSLCGQLFDLVIIDGPPSEKSMNRYPALPFLLTRKLLADRCAVFLDDVHRKAERQIVQRWQKELKIPFHIINDRIAVFHRGTYYNPKPAD